MVTSVATDNVGNTSSCSFTITVQDTIPPTVVTKSFTVNLDPSGNATITAADVNNGSFDNCTITNYSVSPSSTCANVGANTVTLTATDSSGNSASAPATVTLKDVTPPTVITKNITVNLDASGNATITAAE